MSKKLRLQSPQGFCMNGEYKVFYKIRNKLSEMLEKDLSSVTFFCFEQRHEGRWKLVILESSEEDEMEEKRWSPKWSQEKVTRFLYKVGSLTVQGFFLDVLKKTQARKNSKLKRILMKTQAKFQKNSNRQLNWAFAIQKLHFHSKNVPPAKFFSKS